MPRSDEAQPVAFDWRSWLALAWMLVFGLLYVAMMIKEKAPGLWARLASIGG